MHYRQNVSHAKSTFLVALKLSFFVKPRIGRGIHCVKNVAIKMVNSSLRPIISFGHICPSIRISLVPVLVPLILLLFHEIVTFMFEHWYQSRICQSRRRNTTVQNLRKFYMFWHYYFLGHRIFSWSPVFVSHISSCCVWLRFGAFGCLWSSLGALVAHRCKIGSSLNVIVCRWLSLGILAHRWFWLSVYVCLRKHTTADCDGVINMRYGL